MRSNPLCIKSLYFGLLRAIALVMTSFFPIIASRQIIVIASIFNAKQSTLYKVSLLWITSGYCPRNDEFFSYHRLTANDCNFLILFLVFNLFIPTGFINFSRYCLHIISSEYYIVIHPVWRIFFRKSNDSSVSANIQRRISCFIFISKCIWSYS